MNLKILFLFSFVTSFCYSQNKITGKIVDNESNPVEYAVIFLQSKDSINVKSELSDENGLFTLQDVANGSYKLIIQYFSKNSYTQSINVTSNIDLKVISINSITSLDEIVLVANLKIKKELGKYVVTNISSSPLSKNKDSYDFLGTIPIINNGADGNSINIKNKKDAIILINGREVGSSEIALNILKSTPADNIQKIEIITNPSSNYSASNQTGIINIILKKNDEGWKGSVSFRDSQSYYNSQSVNTNLSYSKNNWFLTTGIGANNNRFKLQQNSIYEDYINDNKTSINYDSSSKNKSISPFININYEINSKQNIGLQLNSTFRNNSIIETSSNEYKSLNFTSIDSINNSKINSNNPNFKNLFLNVNYAIKTDSIGSNLELNVYKYNQYSKTQIKNDFFWANFNQSILQVPEINTNLYKINADYTKNFKNEDALKLGISYNDGEIKNDFFYGNYNGLEYISDPLRSNSFKYVDKTLALYFLYQKLLGDNWESEIGLRWENYNGLGISGVNEAIQNNNYLFPSLSLLFNASDNHEFSLEYRSSIIRPPYNYYNPNIFYTSPNSYKVSNSNLLPILSHSVSFNYSFFKHYSFDIEFDSAKNIFNDFDIVLPNGLIQTTTDNYGKGYELWLDFTYSNHFFKERWNFTASLSYIYEKSKGIYNQIDLGYNNNEWGLKLKNYYYLNKKKDAILNLIYGYGSMNRSVLGEMNAMHSLTIELSKSYKNWNLTIGGYDLLQPDLRLIENKPEYGFFKERQYFKTGYFRLSYFFGNNKVKTISKKQDDINERIN
jgi:hypothetical protein